MSAINPPQSLWDRAMAMQSAGQRAQAIELVRVHLRLRPKDADAISLMGVLLQGAGELEESERWLRRAIALSPNNAAAHNNLGVTLSYAGRREEALAAWEHATRIHPKYPLPWISLTSTCAAESRRRRHRCGPSGDRTRAGRPGGVFEPGVRPGAGRPGR